MFERQYVLVAIDWTDCETMTTAINAAVASHDHQRAAADVACLSSTREQLFVLIETWREDGDSQQDPTGAVDAAPAVRKSRRKGKSQDDNGGTASRVEPESVTLPLE